MSVGPICDLYLFIRSSLLSDKVDLYCRSLLVYQTMLMLILTVRNRGIGTGISEASKRVPIFPLATQGGKQASSYFRQRNWVQACEAQIRLPAG